MIMNRFCSTAEAVDLVPLVERRADCTRAFSCNQYEVVGRIDWAESLHTSAVTRVVER